MAKAYDRAQRPSSNSNLTPPISIGSRDPAPAILIVVSRGSSGSARSSTPGDAGSPPRPPPQRSPTVAGSLTPTSAPVSAPGALRPCQSGPPHRHAVAGFGSL